MQRNLVGQANKPLVVCSSMANISQVSEQSIGRMYSIHLSSVQTSPSSSMASKAIRAMFEEREGERENSLPRNDDVPIKWRRRHYKKRLPQANIATTSCVCVCVFTSTSVSTPKRCLSSPSAEGGRRYPANKFHLPPPVLC